MSEFQWPPVSRRDFVRGAGVLTAAAVTGAGTAAGAAPAGETIARTRGGRLRGAVSEGVHVFKGVPYGASTAGPRRFLPPRPAEAWQGTRDALAYGPAAPQNPSTFFPSGDTSEDCLVLNVWTPGLDDGKRPVMVWLHGGGFSSLSGSSPMYDGINLGNRGDVVVVTLNHRLNAFGYLHLGDVLGGELAESGNAGMLDIVLALRWVRDNIAGLGGDPDNVTIFGESGGGRKVTTLLAMPDAAGLFHRAIIESGPGIHLQPRDKSDAMTVALLAELGIAADKARQLLEVPAQRLLDAYEAVAGRLDPMSRARGRFEQRGFVPTVGIESLPQYAFDPVATPLSRDVPVLIGTNRHEMALFMQADAEIAQRTLTEEALAARLAPLVGAAASRVTDVYRRVYPDTHPAVRWILMITERTYRFDSITLAGRKAAQAGAPVYMYRFDWESPQPGMLAHHALEIPFVFDNVVRVPTWTEGSEAAQALAAKMSDAWIAFARSGDPGTKALPKWPAYDARRRATMLFDNEPRVADDPDAEIRRLWATV